MKGRYRLLILDGYKSYYSTNFELQYKENNIITLYMPLYSSYKLQPLDISCFCALKRSYNTEIEKLIYVYITYVSKEDFFPAFYNAFCTAITESNIRGGFRGLGLVLYNPDYIISQLNIIIPALLVLIKAELPLPQIPLTLQNVVQTDSQSLYLQERIV